VEIDLFPKRLYFPKDRLYTPEKEGVKPMTIAAGFRCKDGVVLCADTEITVGATGKKYQSKLFRINTKAESFLAYTGDVEFTNELVEKLRETTEGKTGEEVLAAARDIYRDFWKEHYTQAPKSEKTWAHIILTAREGPKIVLWLGHGQHCYRVEKYQPLGIGEEAGEILFRPFYKPEMSVREAIYMAVYALLRAKRSVQRVGGDTQIRYVSDDWQPYGPFLAEGVRKIEDNFQFFEEKLRLPLLAFSDLSVPKVRFHALLMEFQKAIERQRNEQFRESERLAQRRERDLQEEGQR
jgi:20S proteasome alpha/beta subunit